MNHTDFCYRISDNAIVACTLPEVLRVETGSIRVSLLGKIYTWSNPGASISDNLGSLARSIEVRGLRDSLLQLDGAWMLIIEDLAGKTISFATDHRGTHPVYLLSNASGTYIASSMSTICEHTHVSFDEDRVAAYLSRGDKDSGQPLYRGSQRIGPGYITKVDQAGRIEQEKWLTWDDQEHYKPDLSKIRTLLVEAVANLAKQLSQPVAATLSGGIDSTTACIALRGMPGFRCYSVDAGPNADNETDEIAETLRITKMAHAYVPASFSINELKQLVCASGEPVRGLKTISTIYSCAKRAGADGKKSLVIGWGPDIYFLWGTRMQVLQYMHFLVTHRLLRTLIRSVPRLSRYYGGGTRKMIRDFVLAEVNAMVNKGNITHAGKPDSGHHLKPEYARTTPLSRPIHLKKWTIQMLAGTTLSPSARAIEKLTGVEVAAPFFSRHLTQYVLGCKSRHMLIDGHTKAMMRKALEGTVPQHVAWPPVKKKVPYRPMEEIVFDRSLSTTVETAISSSGVLRNMLTTNPIVAFHSDREGNRNADFWLRCSQVAFLEQLTERRCATS